MSLNPLILVQDEEGEETLVLPSEARALLNARVVRTCLSHVGPALPLPEHLHLARGRGWRDVARVLREQAN